MKKLSITLLIMLLVIGSALAQQQKKSKSPYQEVQADVPKAVLEAVERNHEGFHFQQEVAALPKAKAKIKTPRIKPPKVAAPREVEPEIAYTSYMRRGSEDGKVRSVKRCFYDANGAFISSREVLTNKALPVAARRTIGKEFNGWELERTRAVIESKGNSRTVFYSVVVKNGKDRKRILLNAEGMPLRNKKNDAIYALKAKR